MENFKIIKKFFVIFDIIVLPLMIFQSIIGKIPFIEWIILIVANIILLIFNKKYKNEYED